MPKRKRSLKEKRAQKRNVLVGVGIAVCVGAVVTVAFLARLPEVTITDVRVDGATLIDTASVVQVVEEELAGSYLWLVPRKNTFFYPEQALEQRVQAAFPPVHLVDVSRDGFTTIVVAIEERQSVALWCAGSAPSPCFLMDDTGFLFEPAEEHAALITYRGGVVGEPLGAHFIDGEFPALHTLMSAMHEATQRTVQEVVVDEYNDLYVYFKEGGEVRFVRRYDSQLLLDNITSIFSSPRFNTDEVLEYADFRFGNKVYVKFAE